MRTTIEDDGMPLRGVLARWDAVAIRWGLDPMERSALLGGFEPGPVDRVESYDTHVAERRMRLAVALEPFLAAVVADETRLREWLRAPHRHLEGESPLELMSSSSEWTLWLIGAARLFA